jgi:hypothetical protein
MQPIPYYFEPINRHAIVVKPRKPFYDWLNEIERKNPEPITVLDEHNVYLIREMDSNDEVRRWIKKHFDQLFVNELNDWYTDETFWPQRRTCKLFSEWFDVEVHSMVLDLEDGPVKKDLEC